MSEEEKKPKGKVCNRCRRVVSEVSSVGVCSSCETVFWNRKRELTKFGDQDD